MLASLQETTKQNILQTGRSFREIAKTSGQVYCFKKFVLFHNILRLLDVFPNFPFTTSEMMCDYYF